MTFDEASARYPYDRRAHCEFLTGLEKLRAFEGESMRRAIFELWSRVTPPGERPDPRLAPASRGFLDT